MSKHKFSRSCSRPVTAYGFFRIELLSMLFVRDLIRSLDLFERFKGTDIGDYLLSFMEDSSNVYNSPRKDSMFRKI